ncbi:MAG: superoxide dismutase [Nanoarchaeota archaeon]
MITLPKLDYAYDALEPWIDARTMEIHLTKHHQTYIDKYNAAIKGTELEGKDVHEVLRDLSKVPENIRNAVRNHGGGHVNHLLFWKIMGPNAGGVPTGKLFEAIETKWNNFETFQKEFSDAALNRFGSGWAWLVLNKGKLEITSTANQDSPLSEGKIPLLGIDVWEHAYYLKYQQKRAEYVTNFWNVINWEEVSRRFL